MLTAVTIRDETMAGDVSEPIVLEFLTSQITARALIRERVYQDVKDYNTHRGELFKGLVQPTHAQQTLNGYKMKKTREIDWREQFDRACEAFKVNHILLLVDDRQIGHLDEVITIDPETHVSFLKLIPLVGG